MGTDLHERMLAFDYGDAERKDLMREVWSGHTWMVDAYTGNYMDPRSREMLHWCHEHLGPQASPIHGRPGRWYRGGATIHGWTWIGFADKMDMEVFRARWPTPEGVRDPNAPSALADALSHS